MTCGVYCILPSSSLARYTGRPASTGDAGDYCMGEGSSGTGLFGSARCEGMHPCETRSTVPLSSRATLGDTRLRAQHAAVVH